MLEGFQGALMAAMVSIVATGWAQAAEQIVHLSVAQGELEGTLLTPQASPSWTALLIAGSGPTDRDGNNPQMHNNSLKLLAQALSQAGVASLRYDKRGVAQSAAAGVAESQLRFDHYVDDAVAWVKQIKAQNVNTPVVLIGHSEGALIAMLAAQQVQVDAVISIAGPGFPIDEVLATQLKAQPEPVRSESTRIIAELKQGRTVADVPAYLNSLFRSSVQPYMISWMAKDPRVEVAKLTVPVLIIQGETDIQVQVADANALKAAQTQARLSLIPGMNHVLKDAPLDRSANIATYNQPSIPLSSGLMDSIRAFLIDSELF